MTAHATRRALLATPVLLPASRARAQSFPDRPVRIVVGFAPGGPADVVARIVAQHLGEHWGGKAVVVENRAGAAGVLGVQAVLQAPPDGHTLCVGSNTIYAINPAIIPNLPYEIGRDLAVLGMLARGPQVLAVRSNFPDRELGALVERAKARPESLTLASSGNGTIIHLAGELFAHRAGIRLLHVPYRGGGPAVTALLADEVDMMVNDLSGVLPHIRAGKLHPLAVAGTERTSHLPEVPTFAEAGIPGVLSESWFAISGQAAAPAAARRGVAEAAAAVLASPVYRQRLEAVGLEPATIPADETAGFVQAEAAKWTSLLREARIAVN
jgi:tripartite-type tricarboxylate transporter receptor subunit TctC